MLPSDHRRGLGAALLAAALLLGGCAGAPLAPMRSDALFEQVTAGMTHEEVRRLIGPPDETMAFPLTHTLAWDYRYQDTWGYIAIFSVTFGADGRAIGKTSVRINVGGDHSN